MKTIQNALDTKIDEFLYLTIEELIEKKTLIQEYINLIVTNVENHPTDFADNRLRRNEVESMRTLADVFQYRIEELKEKNRPKPGV